MCSETVFYFSESDPAFVPQKTKIPSTNRKKIPLQT